METVLVTPGWLPGPRGEPPAAAAPHMPALCGAASSHTPWGFSELWVAHASEES